jgi:hypothetical protein
VAGGLEVAKSALKIEKPIESAKSALVDFRNLRDLLKNIFKSLQGSYMPKG